MKTKYTNTELFEFKSILLKKQEENNMQLLSFKNQLEDIADNGKENSIENTGYTVQVEHLISMIARLTKHNQMVGNALTRIENGVFGQCAETGKLIDLERLKAVPTTTLSLEGKRIREQ